MKTENLSNSIKESPSEMKILDLCVDWISFTWRCTDKDNFIYLDSFFEKFPEFDTEETLYVENGRSHYAHCVALNQHIMIYYDGENDVQNKGFLCQIPSSGIMYAMAITHSETVLDLLRLIVERGGNISRLDLCYDDYEKIFSPEWFYSFYLKGRIEGKRYFRSRFNQFGLISTYDGASTFTAGRRTSDKYIRIYNKEAESDGEKPCIRYEFENKGNFARKVVEFLLSGQKLNFRSLIDEYFTIIDPDSDSNISRCSINEEWLAFLTKLEFSEVVCVPPVPADRKISDRWKWYRKQVFPSLCIEFQFDPDGLMSELLYAFYSLDPLKRRKAIEDMKITDNLSRWADKSNHPFTAFCSLRDNVSF